MNLQRQSKEQPEINLTSLIDVVLLLLIFFMVSTTFVREAEISVRLPEAGTDADASAAEPGLEIAITEDGTFLVNGRALVNNEARTLRRAIEQLAGDDRDQPLVIRADAQSVHQASVTAMSVAGEAGFRDIRIATAPVPSTQ